MVAFALAVRWPFRNEVSGDYRAFIGPWYDYIAGHGGFAALRDQFSNYNPPYLYLLAVTTVLPLPKIIAIKTVSVAFDLLLAFAVYKLVGLRRGWTWQPLAAAAIALVLPTVVLNSSFWGQCDSIYASLALLALYQQLRRRTVWAAVLIGLAISFKLQAVFMLPVLAMVWVTQPIRLRRSLIAIALIPLTFLAMLIPALAAGASPSALAAIYPAQVSDSGAGGGLPNVGGGGFASPGGFTGGGGGGAGNPGGGLGRGGGGLLGQAGGGTSGGAPYTRNAASFYQWLSPDSGIFWKYFGLALAAAAIVAAVGVAWRHRRWISVRSLIALAATQLVAIPFLLPQMHDRYFYLADAMLIVAAFWVPRLVPAAIAAQGASLIAYGAYLWNGTLSLRLASTLECVALVMCIWAAAWSLRSDRQNAAERPGNAKPARGISREPALAVSD
jgi:Gpi18-like mannosyltransferase